MQFVVLFWGGVVIMGGVLDSIKKGIKSVISKISKGSSSEVKKELDKTIEPVHKALVDASKVGENFKDFDRFKKAASEALMSLRASGDLFRGLDSSSDSKFATFLDKNKSDISKSVNMSVDELHRLIVKLKKGLPGSLSSYFTGSVTKDLKEGLSELEAKSGEFVKWKKEDIVRRGKSSKVFDRYLEKQFRCLKDALKAEDFEGAKSEISDFFECIESMCGEKFNNCFDEDEDKVRASLLEWWSTKKESFGSGDAGAIDRLFEEYLKEVAQSEKFLGPKVIKNFRSKFRSKFVSK